MSRIVLWDYPKSSASYRVRIGLNLAGLPYETRQVNLLDGAQHAADHLDRNPQGFVPVLDIDGHRLTQSLAILDYLDQTRGLGLLPQDPADRAMMQARAMIIAVDLHPICNLSVATYATNGEEPARTDWMQHFIGKGLSAFAASLASLPSSPFIHGKTPGLADICLIPQLYNARRWGYDFTHLPRLGSVEAACAALPSFSQAHPDRP